MAFFRYSSAVLLGFLSVTALVGAFPLLTSPDGEPWDMPQSLLDHSPFHSFLIPGIVLVIWLTVECLVLRMVLWPHYFYGVVALLLVVFGYVQRKAPFA